jgi:hypothetical protein
VNSLPSPELDTSSCVLRQKWVIMLGAVKPPTDEDILGVWSRNVNTNVH